MWQKTKQGLYKQFKFEDFHAAFAFISKVASLAESRGYYPKWDHEDKVVGVWLGVATPESIQKDMAMAIDSLVETSVAKELDKHDQKLKLYADGGSRGNPGPSASGYVLFDSRDRVILDKGVYLGVTTNNQAEYTALKLGLEAALEYHAGEIDVYMDSLLVINQMKGLFKVRNRDLWPIHVAITELAKRFKKVTFNHVPRELNKAADAAVNRALDEALANGTS